MTALHIAQRKLPTYAHRFSPKTYTQAQLFACLVLKTFHQTDYRGIVVILQDNPTLCHDLGLKRIPHYTTLQKASRRLLGIAKVQRLLAECVSVCQPRRTKVRLAAADASGFEAGQVSPYFIRRRQRGQNGLKNPLYVTTTYTRFPKLNLIADCSSHLILACHPSRGPSPDGPDLPRLLKRLAPGMKLDQLLADAGYDAEHHHEHLRETLGIRSLIPPTRGRPTSKRPTGKWRRLMKRLFKNVERTNYGQRWQVESVFSMIKRNLGDAVHARSYHAQCRELLLKAVTHNVMVAWLRKVFYRAYLSPFQRQ